MKTVGEVLALSYKYLQSKQIQSPRRDVEDLIAHLLGMKRLDLYLNFDRPVDEIELQKLREGLKRLVALEPLEYITGMVFFFGCKIQLNSSVLIPRPETELLVEKIASELQEMSLEGKVFLDLCSGSGCIGIGVKKQFPQLEVILSDKSPAAVALSRENARLNDLELTVLQGDLFEPLKMQKVHFIACNPPYISAAEYELLDPSVKNFEPREALLAGISGLEFYERLAREASSHLEKPGQIWLEIGTGQGDSVKKIFNDASYVNVAVEKDLAGHDRFVQAS